MKAEYENIMIKEAHFFPMRLTTGALLALIIVGLAGFLVIIASFGLVLVVGAYK